MPPFLDPGFFFFFVHLFFFLNPGFSLVENLNHSHRFDLITGKTKAELPSRSNPLCESILENTAFKFQKGLILNGGDREASAPS